MFQTFNENQYYLQSQLLRHGELDWLARNTYFGDQRNYLETDIDDNFLPTTRGTRRRTQPTSTPADALAMKSRRTSRLQHWSKDQQLPHRHAVQRRR